MKLHLIDWIWRIRGSLGIEPRQSAADVLGKVDGMLRREKNTTSRIDGDTLTFTKRDQLPQDKMSVFDGGTIRVVDDTLLYDMKSRALLACFLAPLLFFGVGHIGVAMDQWRNPPEVAKAKAEAAKKRSLVKPDDVPMSSIDKFLGAPQPEKSKSGEEMGRRNRKPSMTTAYVFMGIFFALWLLGRILENVLIHSRLRKTLAGEDAFTDPAAGGNAGSDVADTVGSRRNIGHAPT